MTPEKFKSDVQGAYTMAIRNTHAWMQRADQSHRIFDGVTVFGRDAGVDFIQTFIGLILQESIHAAESKRRTLELRPGKVGKAALAGMVEALGEMTSLPVTEGNGVITIAWAKDEPDLY